MAKEFYKKTWFWVVVVAVVLVLWTVGAYNNFVILDQNINGKWSEVENQYQRQMDLIYNFASTISSQTAVETKFKKDVTALRTSWDETSAEDQLARDIAGQQVSTFVNAVAENYPTLQASEGYTALRDELAGTQNRITVARGDYILAIQIYNTAIKRFPGNVLAGIFGFSAKDYYKANEGSLNTPVLGNGTLPQ